MDQYVQQLDNTLNQALNTFIRKPTLIRGAIHLLLILYAARLAPSLPKQVLQLFENAYFKLFVFSLILWTAQFSPSTSILIALSFLITTNFINQRPLWEFLDNVSDPTEAPLAPSKEVAVDSVVAVVEAQSANTPVVTSIAQKQETIVVQPMVVDTPQGPALVNPTIVVAPAVVENKDGEKVVVKPDVTVVEAPQTLEPASSPESSPAPAPESSTLAPAPPAPEAPTSEEAKFGCYPLRRYDMTKVNAYESSTSYGDI